MLSDTGIDDVKKQRDAEYAKHINDPVLSSLKMEGIRLLFFCSSESRRTTFCLESFFPQPQRKGDCCHLCTQGTLDIFHKNTVL
jgi:hypothetical protein